MSLGNWWSRRWELVVQELGIGAPDPNASRTYRVKRLEVVPGGISAVVQDRERGNCTIEVRVPTLLDKQWERVGDVLSSQALVNAQLLSGAMPPEIEQVFADAGARLLPAGPSEFKFSCSCCPENGCRHLPLIFSLFAEMLDDDPGLLFLLRGKDRQQVLREVRESRGAPSAEAGDVPQKRLASAIAGTTADDAGLWASLDQYWGDRKLLKQFHHHIAPPAVEITLLRRLGPLNTGDEAMALYEQMVTLYRRITEEALALAYAQDELPGEEGHAPN